MRIVSLLISFFLCNAVCGQHKLQLKNISKLNEEIRKYAYYDSLKEIRILSLKSNLNFKSGNRISTLNKIFLEYSHYNFDSAYRYSLLLQAENGIKNNATLYASAKLKTVLALMSGGMLKETFDLLNLITIANVADSVIAEYYKIKGLAYYLLTEYNNTSVSPTLAYDSITSFCLDSALTFLEKSSFEYRYFSAIQLLRKKQNNSAWSILNQLYKPAELTQNQIALVANVMAGIWNKQDGRYDERMLPYLIDAAIADIRASDKDNTSLYNLAGVLYRNGFIEEAVNCIEKANLDVSFYNTRLRKVQVGTILPPIEAKMTGIIKYQKKKLQVFLIIISTLAFFLAVLVVIIWKQVKRLSVAKQNIYEANEKQKLINEELLKTNALKEVYNNELQVKNRHLFEANRIKEEYIGNYFNQDTLFIARMEKSISQIEKKVTDRKWEEARFFINNINLKKEKEELLNSFDHIFLKLFPNFVAQFNSLFGDEDKIVLKEGQLLNAELRIFALIRLGVIQNEKIAEILDYSINTIYAKKTKVKSKTIVSKEQFEEKLVEITNLHY